MAHYVVEELFNAYRTYDVQADSAAEARRLVEDYSGEDTAQIRAGDVTYGSDGFEITAIVNVDTGTDETEDSEADDA